MKIRYHKNIKNKKDIDLVFIKNDEIPEFYI